MLIIQGFSFYCVYKDLEIRLLLLWPLTYNLDFQQDNIYYPAKYEDPLDSWADIVYTY